MAKGGAPEQSQTTKQNLSPEQQQLLQTAMPGLTKFGAGGAPKLPGFSGVSGFDLLQTQGQEQVLGEVGSQAGVVGSAAGANQRMTSGELLSPDSNPALRSTIEAANRPVWEGLMEKALPTIRGQAATTGNYGGSRQGIAEGIAMKGAVQNAGDNAARIATAGYGAGLDAMGRGVAMAPQTAGALSIPGSTTSSVGDVRQNLAQQILGEQYGTANYNEMAPFLLAKDLAGMVAGIPGGSTTTTATTPQKDPWSSAAGGAIAGGTLGAKVGGPWGAAAGAGAGGLLGYFG